MRVSLDDIVDTVSGIKDWARPTHVLVRYEVEVARTRRGASESGAYASPTLAHSLARPRRRRRARERSVVSTRTHANEQLMPLLLSSTSGEARGGAPRSAAGSG